MCWLAATFDLQSDEEDPILQPVILRLIACAVFTLALLPAGAIAAPAPVAVLTLDGAIGPASADYVTRSLARAASEGAQLAVLRIDTPGGLDSAMRAIIKAILASPIPVATYVSPSGARAASAGTYILYASHFAAMTPGTTLGAATPVQLGGSPGPERPLRDDGNGKDTGKDGKGDAGTPGSEQATPGSAMTRKQVNDAAAYIRGLAQLRGRNAEWAELAVRQAVSLSASEALQQNVVDLVAPDVPGLLRELDGRAIQAGGREHRLQTRDAPVVAYQPDGRTRFLAAITDPSVALLLMMLGFYGLILEFGSPGLGVAGVLGAIALLTGLYALQLLPVNYAGMALILLGVGFMVAEAFAPSFGFLGLGGVVAFVLGALILIDTDLPGFGIPLSLVIALGLGSALLIGVTASMAVKARRRPVVSGAQQMAGALAEVVDDTPGASWASIHGEIWKVASPSPLRRGQKVRILGRRGLVLDVAPDNNHSAGDTA